MKKVSSIQRYQTEKAIIDALLKISEIIKKTKNTNQHSKKRTGDGDKKQQRNESDYAEIYDVPIPPPTRTLESYVSSFNKQYAMSSSNCNRAPILLLNSRPYDKRYYSTGKTRRVSNDYRDRDSIHKRHHYENSLSSSISSLSNNHHHHRKKSSRYYAKYRSSEFNKKRQIKCQCQTSYDNNKYSASDC